MDLSKNELQELCNQKEMLKINIERMSLSENYEELDIEWMLAKSKIDDIYKLLQKHLHDNYDKEIRMEINTPIQKPKEGYWKEQKVGNMTVLVCDQCGFCFPLIRIGGYFNYCPDCGSIMHEDEGILEQLAERQNSLSTTNKAWSNTIEKNGYIN